MGDRIDHPHRATTRDAARSRKRAPARRTASRGPEERARAGKRIRVGIGGWTFEPWRGVFYPQGLPHARELAYASERLTSIEINGTFYRTQSPATFAKWARETPSDFVFAVKGPRYATTRRVLAEAGDSIKRFLESGVLELGDKLGPLLWQFAPTKKFEAVDFGKFLELLPPSLDGRRLRHVVEVRHGSFCAPQFITLLRQFKTPVVFAEHASYPAIPDPTGEFVYARLQKGNDRIETAYSASDLDAWAERTRIWARGGLPEDLTPIDPEHPALPTPRDVFVYFIHEGKVRAPAAAMAMIARLGR
jgi:uncharacterized protein YecE (DUF72 family)